MSQIIVLGWDGLDLEVAERYGVADAFGVHRSKIDTYVNPYIDAPHTKELWPSMITGVHPDEHGIHAATPGDGVNWDSDLLKFAAKHAQSIIPDGPRTRIGNALRRRGIGLEEKPVDYYREHGIETVFDDVGGRAISIPNYRTDADADRGLDAHRDDLWAALDVDWNQEVGMRPRVDRERVYHLLGEEVGRRVGETAHAVASGEPLVWTWFGLLDTVGHMQPALGDDLVREWYQVAAGVTETVRQLAGDETTVLCISDHGIQGGTHTEYATVASDDPAPVEAIGHVFDVAAWIDQRRPTAPEPTAEPTTDAAAIRDVQAELEALGYVDG